MSYFSIKFLSSSVKPWSSSTRYSTLSDLAIDKADLAMPSFSTSSLVSCIPAVSIIFTMLSSIFS